MKRMTTLLLLAMTTTQLMAQHYEIQNRQPAGTGFTITVDGEVVGYSDTGTLDAATLPPAASELLEHLHYEQQLAGEGRAVRRAPRRAAAIAPMLTTRWGQRQPYNLLCPEYAEGSHCATGCLAVAMAQILKYWSANIPTAEIPAYTTETKGYQLPALPSTTFDYSIMKDEYLDILDHGTATMEVARLMLYCGQASQMDYDINSGAYTMGSYLADYFGFSSEYEDKDHWTHLIDWEDYIYDELAAGRPLLYSGKKMSGAGHVFVVDGYENGYFHINWGWEGNSNGFFKLSLCNPDDPDSAYLWEGYRWLQKAVVGLQPDPTATGITALPAATPSGSSPFAASTVCCDSVATDPQGLLGRQGLAGHHPLFDLQGRPVIAPSAKGVYIWNGKKMVIR